MRNGPKRLLKVARRAGVRLRYAINGEGALRYHHLALINHERRPVEGPVARTNDGVQAILNRARIYVGNDLGTPGLLVGSALHAEVNVFGIERLAQLLRNL